MELTKIRGINEKREQEFYKLGIKDTADLVRHFPRAYLDLREKQLLHYVYHNDIVLTVGTVLNVPYSRQFRRGGGLVKVTCEQEGLIFSVVWFNQPYVVSKLKVGEEYLFYGRVQRNADGISLLNPSFEPCDKAFRLKGIVPQYTVKGTLGQKIVRDAVRLAVDIEKPSSIIPPELQKIYNLKDLYSAYKTVHNPSSFEAQKQSAERIAIEEYFKLISAFKFIKGSR